MKSNAMSYTKAKLGFIFAVTVFGTVGVVSSFIPLSSSAIVFYRAVLTALFLIVSLKVRNEHYNIKAMNENLLWLVLGGIFMSLNWVFQFEAFKVSSVSIGTVCYNTMPIFYILLASIIFKEKLTPKNIICVLIATFGVFLVSNVIVSGIKSNDLLGCIYGLLGALFYALCVITTKKMSALNSIDKLIFEFILAAFVMIPYMIFIQHSSIRFEIGIDQKTLIIGVIMLLFLSFFHTGFSYVVYFDCVSVLKAEEVAILTYIDPVIALILSALILGERLNVYQIIGAVLILLSTIINEFVKHRVK